MDFGEATDWESIKIDDMIYLAVANKYDGSTSNIPSKIYQWDESLWNEFAEEYGKFKPIKSIPTNAAVGWGSLTINNEIYLAVANSADTSTSPWCIINSNIFRWDGSIPPDAELPSDPEPPFDILTYAARDWEGFEINGEAYFAVANHYDCSTLETYSKIYKFIRPVQKVSIDIKPGSCPNPINVQSKGVLHAAILGTADFDVTVIDTASVRLSGVAPLRSNIEDVATPFEPYTGKEYSEDCNDYDQDGFDDLTLKFKTQGIVEAIGTVDDGDVLILKLTGELTDGTPIEGEDVILIKKKGKK